MQELQQSLQVAVGNRKREAALADVPENPETEPAAPAADGGAALAEA